MLYFLAYRKGYSQVYGCTLILISWDLLSVSEVTVCIHVLRDLRAGRRWKSRDDVKSEMSYVSQKDCPATGVTGRLPPCSPPPPRVARGDRLPGFNIHIFGPQLLFCKPFDDVYLCLFSFPFIFQH